MRLPPRYAPVLTGLLLTAVMTIVVAGVSTFLALGLTPEAIARWPLAWGTSWLIAFPTVPVVLPRVRRVVDRLVDQE